MPEQTRIMPLAQRLSRYASALNEAMKASEALIAPSAAIAEHGSQAASPQEQARSNR